MCSAINLGVNVHRSTGGKISYSTLLAFVALQVLTFPTAFSISNPEKVQREDGSTVKVDARTSTHDQIKILGKTIISRKIGPLLPIFFSKSMVCLTHFKLLICLIRQLVLLGIRIHFPDTLFLGMLRLHPSGSESNFVLGSSARSCVIFKRYLRCGRYYHPWILFG